MTPQDKMKAAIKANDSKAVLDAADELIKNDIELEDAGLTDFQFEKVAKILVTNGWRPFNK